MVRRTVAGAVLLLLVACSSGGDADIAGAPAVPPSEPAMATTTTATAAPSTTVAEPVCPAANPPRRPPDPNRPRYTMTLNIQPRAGTVTGTIDVRFVPDFETDRIVFRLWANGPRQRGFGARLTIPGPVEVDGGPVAPNLDDLTMLVLRPGGTIRAGQAVQVRGLRFNLQLPQPARDRLSGEADSVRLGSFFPILEWEPGTGWTEDPPTTRFAEASTAPAADYDLTITTPPGYTAIASGVPDRPGHWTATAMRDIAVAAGHFTTASGVARAPDAVQVTVGVEASLDDAPQAYLNRAIAVLEASSRRFGPYAWPTFFVSVTPGISTGIEYPGHILHGPDTANDILTHEVAHQWFYALVGNNQAQDPWLDEALTTWVEARYEETVESYKARGIPSAVVGRTAAPMTYWDQSDAFYVGAYVQGAQALAALGEPDQVDCALRLYAAEQAYRIAKPADLLGSLTKVFPDAAATLARYGIRP